MNHFWTPAQKSIFGMIHLWPLPGSPGYSGLLADIEQQAVQDAEKLIRGGVDGLMIENFGDIPFFKDANRPHTIAIMTRIILKVKALSDLPIGVNVLRNDIQAALGIASAVEAQLVRVNVHTGVMVTDQGIVEGKAAESIRYRQELGLHCALFADVDVKHAAQLGNFSIEALATDTAYRGLADGLIVSGSGTGQPADPSVIRRVRAAVPDRPIWIGSGLSRANLAELWPLVDGAIVGTEFKIDGVSTNPVDPGRVAEFMSACRSRSFGVIT